MAKVLYAPYPLPAIDFGTPILFLAGSIEMGKAEKWQDTVIESLKDTRVLIMNPRRDDWDSSWEQTINDEKFKEQVLWELNGLEYADIICFYFDPNTKAPITLFEIGLLTGLKQHSPLTKIVVCCPDGYWRKGNIEVVCDKYKHVLVDNLDDMIAELEILI